MSIIEVTVKSQKGKCNFGHKVGDKLIFDGKSVKGDICYGALIALRARVWYSMLAQMPRTLLCSKFDGSENSGCQ